MKPALPQWLLVAFPATLAGHALAYALTGRPMLDGRHGYFIPGLECSAAIALAFAIAVMAAALMKSGAIARLRLRNSGLALWGQLASVQLVLFCGLESIEGFRPSVAGCATQVVVALAAVLCLKVFASAVDRCVRAANEAAVYLERLLEAGAGFFVPRAPVARAYALRVRAGSHHRSRPPPQT